MKFEVNGVEFKEGDRVMVMCFTESFDPNGMGEGRKWDNSWVEDMNSLIFECRTIREIDEELGAIFEEDGEDGYYFPLSVLKNLSAAGVESNQQFYFSQQLAA